MFTILTKNDCPWCDKAKDLLKEMKVPYGAFNYTDHPVIILLMKKANLKTVPQIWTNTPDGNTYIGGYEDLVNWLKEHKVESSNA